MNELEKKAVLYKQAPSQAESDKALVELCRAAVDYAESLEDVKPGLDPTPATLAREVQSAAQKAGLLLPLRLWSEDGDARDWMVFDAQGQGVVTWGTRQRKADGAFVSLALNAAEPLARAVLENEELTAALKKEVAELEEVADEACSYVPAYFTEKWGIGERLAAIKAARGAR